MNDHFCKVCMKDIKFYSWDDCPIGYRSFSPFTRDFFETHYVLLIMVVLNPDWNQEATRRALRALIRPSDTAKGTLDGVPLKVFFWTQEKP